jgi:hypothetical protein
MTCLSGDACLADSVAARFEKALWAIVAAASYAFRRVQGWQRTCAIDLRASARAA